MSSNEQDTWTDPQRDRHNQPTAPLGQVILPPVGPEDWQEDPLASAITAGRVIPTPPPATIPFPQAGPPWGAPPPSRSPASGRRSRPRRRRRRAAAPPFGPISLLVYLLFLGIQGSLLGRLLVVITHRPGFPLLHDVIYASSTPFLFLFRVILFDVAFTLPDDSVPFILLALIVYQVYSRNLVHFLKILEARVP